jgi:hypothetical protein
MKPLKEVEHWKIEFNEEARQAALDTMIEAQIRGLERLLENNGAHVKSPMAYNTCASLIEQLKYYAPACFRSGEFNFDEEVKKGFSEQPLYGKP